MQHLKAESQSNDAFSFDHRRYQTQDIRHSDRPKFKWGICALNPVKLLTWFEVKILPRYILLVGGLPFEEGAIFNGPMVLHLLKKKEEYHFSKDMKAMRNAKKIEKIHRRAQIEVSKFKIFVVGQAKDN